LNWIGRIFCMVSSYLYHEWQQIIFQKELLNLFCSTLQFSYPILPKAAIFFQYFTFKSNGAVFII